MTVPVPRSQCGSHGGLVLHAAAGEPACSRCALADRVTGLELERLPAQHRPVDPGSVEALLTELVAVLAAMVDADARQMRADPSRRRPRGRRLRAVS